METLKIHPELLHIIEDCYGSLKRFDNIGDLSLYHDLSIYGDDADELLVEYARKFNVAFSDFKWTDYFPNEGFSTSIFDPIRKKKYKPLTISDLQRGIEAGKLFL